MILQHRPSLVIRGMIALIAFGIVMTNAALLLSDQAPGVLRSLFGDLARRITERLDGDGRAGAALGTRDIGGDSIIHFSMWAIAMLVIGLAVWSWARLAIASVTVAATSLIIEAAQGRYSSSRVVEATDAAFNLLGVAVGAGTAAAVYIVVEGLGHLFAPSD
ncbi:MAG: hypothetical protein P8I25_03395 [Ilumatobacter sp.]|nr:hypothetical protein [Ilumatobacter sp.]MDG1695391.1 hypothetical protein [Ilumatobacter sp.]